MEGKEQTENQVKQECSPSSPKNSPDEQHSPSNDKTNDTELDDLLDSALADFDKPLTASAGNSSDSAKKEDGDKDGKGLTPDQEALFNDIFASGLADEANVHFEEAMKSLMSEDPTMMKQLEKLSEAAGTLSESGDSQQQFVEALHDTVANMAKNAQGLQEGDISEDDIIKAMTSLGLGPEPGGATDGQEQGFIPLMQQMMKSLLSKDVLYPSLKEISEKYPGWLTENETNLEHDKYENYNKQYELMKKICDEFEAETETDSDDVKRDRFERVLDLMQKMQECGQPPPEIVGEMAPGLQFDENGMPSLPDGAASQCCVM